MSGEFHDYDAILFLFGDIAIEWRLNVHDETARMKKKGRMDYPSISIDKYHREKLSSERAW